MKKFLNLFALVLCVTFLASTVANAQDIKVPVRNSTNCAFNLRVTYAKALFPCQGPETIMVQVPALSNVLFQIPEDTEVIEVSGRSATNCPFNIGSSPCSTFPISDSPVCVPPPSTSCDNYTAEWVNATNTEDGVWIHN